MFPVCLQTIVVLDQVSLPKAFGENYIDRMPIFSSVNSAKQNLPKRTLIIIYFYIYHRNLKRFITVFFFWVLLNGATTEFVSDIAALVFAAIHPPWPSIILKMNLIRKRYTKCFPLYLIIIITIQIYIRPGVFFLN